MSLTVFLAVILAAALHACWNAVLKGGSDKLVSMTAVMTGHMIPAMIALFFVPLPAVESLPFMVASVCFHFGYQVFLVNAYRLGDLTQVYPLARGTAPLVVTLVSVAVLGEQFTKWQLASIGLICLGLLSLSITRNAEGLRNPRAAGLAIITGLFIAGYSLVDGLGARAAGTAIGFMSVMMILNGLLFLAYATVFHGVSSRSLPGRAPASFFIGGFASFAAYGLVVWGFTEAPIAVVTALRETSIVFAILIGVIFLKERLNLAKLVSTLLTISGAVLIRLAR